MRISKVCIYYIVRTQDPDYEISPIESLPVVSEFPEIFPNDLPGIPPQWEINFFIDYLADTNPILIPPYQMALDEFKVLKVQLKDFLYQCFITLDISPWVTPVLFLK